MDFRKVHSQKYTLINTKRLYFNTKRIIFGPWYKVNFAEDNFVININSKFRDSVKLINIFVKFAILGTQIHENIFLKNIFS